MSSNIKNIILNYISFSNVNYGIFIKGEWGCGKTFLWKNTLEKVIEENKKKTLYLSINGLTSVEDVSRRILLNIIEKKSGNVLTEKNKKHIEMFSKIADPVLQFVKQTYKNIEPYMGMAQNILRVDLKANGILELYNLSDHVICLDDFERYKGNVEELLGFCNDLLEHRGAYLVIIGNEDEIKSEVYRKVKEKVIGKTIAVRMTKNEILESIVNEVSNERSKEFLIKNIPLINTVINNSGRTNYRVIIMLIREFSYIYNVAMKSALSDIGLTSEVLNVANTAVLKFILAAGIEIHAKGISNDDMKELQCVPELELKELVAAVGNKKNTSVYFSDFKKRYYSGISTEREFFPSVLFYLIDGDLNCEKFNLELKRFKEDNPQIIDYVLHLGYWNLSDKDFREGVEGKLLDEINEGKICVCLYPRLFLHYAFFSERRIMNVSIDDIKDKFLHGLEYIKENGQDNIGEKDDIIIFLHEHLDSLAVKAKKYYEEIAERTKHVLSCLIERKKSIQSVNFFELMQDDFHQALKRAFPSSGEDFINGPLFLVGVNPKSLYDFLITQDNKSIVDFQNMLENRMYYVDKDVLDKDCIFFQDLVAYIDENLSKKDKLELSESLMMQLSKNIKSKLLGR